MPDTFSGKPKTSARSKKPRQDDQRLQVRQSWQDDRVKVVLVVPPHRRRHVIGPRGDTIRQLRQQYPAVRVSVPLPQDLESHDVILQGPKTQVNAAAREITRRLEAIETELLEEKQRREAEKGEVMELQVAASMRRYVVGPGGETLRQLAREYPGVRVTVPPPSDTHTSTISIRGRSDEAAAVMGCIKTLLEAVEQRQQQRAAMQ